jgi:hypothetical protein
MRRRSSRFSVALLVLGMAAALLPAGSASGVGAGPTPTFYPVGFSLGTTAYTARFNGVNRYATAGTIADQAAANGEKWSGCPGSRFGNVDFCNSQGYPFVLKGPDHNGVANSLWGSATDCPDGVALAAGDTPADTLTAAQANEFPGLGPDVQNSGSVDVKLQLLTTSTRQGATDLSSEAVVAMQRIRQRCASNDVNGRFDVVIFGGEQAVPKGADITAQLVSGGHVYRVAGADRFDTAKITALTGDVEPDDFEYWPDAATGETVIPKSAVLAEGFTGADALAIGPVLASHNIPMLLTGSTFLPSATSAALAGLGPQNLIVMGGTNAISDAVANAAAAAAGGAKVTRVFGPNRYGTSVEIAKHAFGLWPENAAPGGGAATYSNQPFMFARSEGALDSHVGWPDALASAKWSHGLEDCWYVPERMAPPIERNQGLVKLGSTPDCGGPFQGSGRNSRSPLLLTTQSALSSEVSSYLAGLYPDKTEMTTATNAPPTRGVNANATNNGGFGYIFGGSAAIASGTELSIAQLLSGGTYAAATQSDLKPTMDAAGTFYTALDLSGYQATDNAGASNGGVDPQNFTGFDQPKIDGGDKICHVRNALVGSEYLTAYNVDDGSYAASEATKYEPTTPVGEAFPAAQSRLQCVKATTVHGMKANVVAESLSGNDSVAEPFDWSTAAKIMSTVVATPAVAGSFSGDPTVPQTTDGSSSTSMQNYSGTVNVNYKGTTTPAAPYVLALTLTRTDQAGPSTADRVTVTGVLTITTTAAVIVANLTGEVVGSNPGATMLSVGEYVIGTGASAASGGFHLTTTLTGGPTTWTLSDLALQGNA